jgi:hypothetical protein
MAEPIGAKLGKDCIEHEEHNNDYGRQDANRPELGSYVGMLNR